MRVSHVLLAILGALFAHWSAYALPLVHLGSVAVPGFAAVAVGVSLALLLAVIWFTILRPVLIPSPYVRGVRVA